MTAKRIQKTIENQKLQLSFFQKCEYFSIVFLLLFICLIITILIRINPINTIYFVVLSIIFPLTIYIFYILNKQLKCHFIPFPQQNLQKRKVVESVIRKMKWGTSSTYSNYIIAYHCGKSRREKEIITILFTENGILINSRPDITAGPGGAQSIFSLANNKENIISFNSEFENISSKKS